MVEILWIAVGLSAVVSVVALWVSVISLRNSRRALDLSEAVEEQAIYEPARPRAEEWRGQTL